MPIQGDRFFLGVPLQVTRQQFFLNSLHLRQIFEVHIASQELRPSKHGAGVPNGIGCGQLVFSVPLGRAQRRGWIERPDLAFLGLRNDGVGSSSRRPRTSHLDSSSCTMVGTRQHSRGGISGINWLRSGCSLCTLAQQAAHPGVALSDAPTLALAR
jgi:hypothetical protein